MKKAFSMLAVLAMILTLAAGALAAETEAPSFAGGIQFNMDMTQVMEIVNLKDYEIESEKTRGTVEFYELEYENVPDAEGFAADVTYLFVGNSLVAIQLDMADNVTYDQVKAALTATYGEAVPFDAAKVGNGRYAIDDDGDLKKCKEMILGEGVMIVLEEDRDGEVNVTILDPTAAYINN